MKCHEYEFVPSGFQYSCNYSRRKRLIMSELFCFSFPGFSSTVKETPAPGTVSRDPTPNMFPSQAINKELSYSTVQDYWEGCAAWQSPAPLPKGPIQNPNPNSPVLRSKARDWGHVFLSTDFVDGACNSTDQSFDLLKHEVVADWISA